MSLYTRSKHCYVLSVPSGHVKVGISDHIERRLGEIQAQFYEPVKFEVATRISSASPVCSQTLESLVHLKLKPFATWRREWFAIDPGIAVDVWLATYWFLAIPPGHKDIERVHPNWSAPRTMARAVKVDTGLDTDKDLLKIKARIVL